jgi:DNA-binding LacI/PurR family transcriptional regulator
MRQRAEAGAEEFSFHLSMPSHGVARSKVALHDGLIQEIESGCVQGIISVGLDEDITDWIDAQGIPNVAFAGAGRYHVMIDAEELVRLAVKQLVEKGCRKVAFWQAAAPRRKTEHPRGPSQESEAFAEALQRNGLTFDTKLVRLGADHLPGHNVIATESTQEQGYRIATEVFSRGRKTLPDGIVINDDLMTRGALSALAKLGVQVGRDVKIATHANRGSTVLMGHEHEMSLVEIDPAELVQAIFGMLETLMNGETPPQECVSILPRLRA